MYNFVLIICQIILNHLVSGLKGHNMSFLLVITPNVISKHHQQISDRLVSARKFDEHGVDIQKCWKML